MAIAATHLVAHSAETHDILEITRVVYRSFQCSDEKRWNEWVTYFNDDLTIEFGDIKPSQILKPADLANWLKLSYSLLKTQHMIFNLDVKISGNQGASNSYGYAMHERIDTNDFWYIYPKYEHEYIRATKGWKITRVKMTPNFQEGNPELISESYAAALKSL